LGYRIRAAVAISVGAAIMGLTKLRQASIDARSAVNNVATAQKEVNKAATLSERLRHAAGAPGRVSFGLGFKKRRPVKRLGEFLGAPTEDERREIGQAVLKSHVKFKSPFKGQDRTKMTAEQLRYEVRMHDIALKKRRLMLQEANLLKRMADTRRQTVTTAVKGVNAITRASREARSWYKILFGTMNKHGKPRGIKVITNGVKGITRHVRTTNREFGRLGTFIGSTLGAIGGMAVLGGAGSLFSRALGLARAREDARVTFDTLLGTVEKSEILLSRITKFAAQTPFQLADIVDASRQLLTVTGKNVDMNEELFMLASNMAALKPGTKVADVASAMVSASVGTFTGLKTMGIVLKADQFKGEGKQGGEQYSRAVMDAIRAEFEKKTEGRDLVGSLSRTMSGLMSTFKDNLELTLGNIGEVLVDELGMKQFFQDIIPEINKFARLIKFATTGQGEFDFFEEDVSPAMLLVVSHIEDMILNLKWLKGAVIETVSSVVKWFSDLPHGIQHTMISAAGAIASFVAGVTVVGPILLGLVALGAALAGPLEAIGGAAAGVGLIMGSVLGAALAAIGVAFMLFRAEGESVFDTLFRLVNVIQVGVMGAWNALSVVFSAMWPVLVDAILPAWKEVEDAFLDLQKALFPVIDAMFTTNATSRDMVNAGRMIGEVIGLVIKVLARMVSQIANLTNLFVQTFTPAVRATISDVKVMAKAFMEWVDGTRTMKSTIGVVLAGFADVITLPFREAIAQLFEMFARSKRHIENAIRPYSTMIADMIGASAAENEKAADDFRQGLLRTREDMITGGLDAFMQIDSNSNVYLNTTVEVDGERVATSLNSVEMRSRNSGRGGNPLTPEEQGFAVSDGKIRVVNTTDVLSRMGGGN